MSEPVGIIYPPPELRGIVDSTAKYVAKNGAVFEERIKREHKDKPKFSFLFSDDPFHAYYQHKVRENRSVLLNDLETKTTTHDEDSRNQPESTRSVNDEQADNRPQEPRDGHDNDQQHSIKNGHEEAERSRDDRDIDDQNEASHGGQKVRMKLDEYIHEKTMRLVEPPLLNFLAKFNPSITDMETDIIKLTSQFIATYGRNFLLELVSREQNNSEFDFLKPQHGQFSHMTHLIMQYALIRNRPLDILEQLEKDASSQKHVFEKIRMRAEWNRMLEAERKRREEAEEKEKILYSQIDWQDFVVVEEIEYNPDETGEYPPTTADQVGTRMLLQQRYEEQRVPEEMDIDMEMDSDNEEDNFAVPEPPAPDKVVIKKDYDPKQAVKAVQEPDNYFVSPITNERIPVDKIHEHVRYNLADPKYLEKKEQMMQDRMNEETVFASGSQVQDNLRSLAERRTDIFGVNDEETVIGRRIGEEEEPAKDDRLIWDGHKSSLKKKKRE